VHRGSKTWENSARVCGTAAVKGQAGRIGEKRIKDLKDLLINF
jgi:hypothetical protein